jgi:hypothetical protein
VSVTVRTNVSTPPNNGSFVISAPCNAGETILSGGYSGSAGSNLAVTSNNPDLANQQWTIAVKNANGVAVTVYAVCKA